MLAYWRVVGSCQCFFDWGGLQQAKNSNPSIGEETMLTGGCRIKIFGPPKIPGKQKSFQLDFGDPFGPWKPRRFSDFFKTESHGKPRVTCQETGLRTARVSQSFPGRDPPKKKGRLSVKQRNYCESQTPVIASSEKKLHSEVWNSSTFSVDQWLAGGFKYFLFSPLLGDDFQFD